MWSRERERVSRRAAEFWIYFRTLDDVMKAWIKVSAAESDWQRQAMFLGGRRQFW